MSKPLFEVRHDSACRICKGNKIPTVFSLAPTPAEDQFVTEAELSAVQKTYPLDLAFCESCGYVFLPDVLNPELSYPNYTYVTKVTLGLSNHYQDYADELISRFEVPADALVVDLGSNDGTMLEAFKKRGRRVTGVEPGTSVARIANDNGISTINAFFTEDTVEQITAKNGKATVVTANYMFANIDDLHSFTKNVAALLADDGLFSVQTGYHPEQMKILMFDYIYHEHFSYFTVAVLERLFHDCGLELISVQKTTAKGGSIRVVAQKRGGKRARENSVDQLLAEEQRARMDKKETYLAFAEKINSRRAEVRTVLDDLKAKKKSMAGYGASHSTTTLLYHFGLREYLSYIVDDNPTKQGRYSPGYHIPVFPADTLLKDKPDYVVILAWQYRDPIERKNQAYLDAGGTFISPLPDLRISSRK